MSFSSDGLQVEIANNTALPWRLGGVRFNNEGFIWSQTNVEYPGFVIDNTDRGEQNEVELFFPSASPPVYTELPPGKTQVLSHPPDPTSSSSALVPGTQFLLLKTARS
ncbi:hypothetical protein QA601_11335 [Chitinispirillales bacterium ANBcel5]|uniref:hypothetical protein n=1 Tax=Cellulosispirillum alkaliphilum TaxID=3039283 RepID=UPI002A56D2A8|nr:hypothetical protein [Chitinispirillales bacterium ANBcel5]